MSLKIKPTVIGFSGPMGCGKSTAIEQLRASLATQGRSVHLVKFAGALYEIQEMIYNRISAAHQRPADFVKDRKLLQWIGTEWGRGLNENLWVNLWKAEVDARLQTGEILSSPPLIVCDDVRFDNEAEVLNEMGGVIVKITTSRNHERIDTKAGIANHASEAGISERFVGVCVDNNDSVQQYQNKLKKIFVELGLTKEEVR